MNPQRLDVGYQILGCVLRGFAMRCGTATATLVEQHAMKPIRIEKAPMCCRNAGAGSAMEEQDGSAVRPANLLEIDVVKAAVQLAAAKGRLHRKQFLFLNESVCHADILAQKDGA